MQQETTMSRPAIVALGLYGVLLAVIGVFPTPVDRRASPLIHGFLARAHDLGIPAWFDYGFIEFTANIFLFAPLGTLLVLAMGRSRAWPAMLAGVGVSLAIEFTQAFLLPERFPSALDVLANGIGAAFGAAVALMLLPPRRVEAAVSE